MKWSGMMTKIKDLKEKDRLKINLMIKSCTKGTTSKGAPYLNLILQDNSGTIDGKMWDAKPQDEANAVQGHVCEVSFEVLEYNHSLQLRVNRIQDLDQSGIDLSEYIQSSSITRAQSEKRVRDLIASLKNENYKVLVQAMLDKVGDAFYQYPAASRIHHSYMGGLAEHSLGMAALAEQIVSLYPLLNRDLLIAGTIVHDLGKTAELGGMISSEYTNKGRLLGHISIGHAWLAEVADEVGLGDSEESMLLRHMVLSHHGKFEFGSPVLPELPEAEALSMIDNLDARMNTLAAALDGVKPGQWTPRIFSMENRQFYKAKGSE